MMFALTKQGLEDRARAAVMGGRAEGAARAIQGWTNTHQIMEGI